MADVNIILSGFLGGFFGSVTSLLGVYLTHRAQEKRGHKEFVRAQLVSRLERQHQAETTYRKAVLACHSGEITDLDIQMAAVAVRGAFGETLGNATHRALDRLRPYRGSLSDIDDAIHANAVADAISEGIKKTEARIGIPAVDDEDLLRRAFARQRQLTPLARELSIPRKTTSTPEREEADG